MKNHNRKKLKEYRRSTWGESHVGAFRSLDKLLSDTKYLVEELPEKKKNTNDLHEHISDGLRAVRKDLAMFHADKKSDSKYYQVVRLNYGFHIDALEWNLNKESMHFNVRFLKESLRKVEKKSRAFETFQSVLTGGSELF